MRLSTPLHCLLATTLLLGASHSVAQSRLLADLTTGSSTSFPFPYTKETMEAEHINGKYYVAVGCRIYRTEGVVAAATPVVEMSGTGCELTILGRLGPRLVFMRGDYELWSTDGNVGTQVRLPVIVSGGTTEVTSGFYHWPRYPGWMLIVLGQYFSDFHEVWLTDGSVANTRLVQATGTSASVAFLRNGRAALLGSGLWRLDSPTATATLVSSGFTEGRAVFSGIDRNLVSPGFKPVTETDTRVYFTAKTAATGTEPWSSDLTAGGTAVLVDHTPGAGSSDLQWAGTPGGDDSYYFTVGDQLFRGTPGSGTAAQINPSGTIVSNGDLRIAPIQAVDGDVMLARITENTGNRIWKLRDSLPGSFAPAAGSPLYGVGVNPIGWFVRWPDRALFGANGGIGSGGINSLAAQVAVSPADVTLTPLTALAFPPERSELRGDQYLQWTEANGARRWRRNATTFESLPLFPAGNQEAIFHARPGGALALFAHPTPITGREPHALDLLPNEIPMCNRPALNVPDNGSALDSIVVLPNGLAAGDIVLDLRLSIKLRHSFVGDLRVSLQHVASGRSAILLDRPGVPQQSSVGCSGNDLDVIFDDVASTSVETCGSTQAYGALVSLQPEQPLGAFRGINPIGAWTLTVVDASGSDFGGVTEWCLDMAAGPQSDGVFSNGFENIPVGP